MMGFQTTPTLVPKLDPFPSFGGLKHEQISKKGIFHLQFIQLRMVKIFRSTTSSNHVDRACVHVEEKCRKRLAIDAHIRHFSLISVHPSYDANTLSFKQFMYRFVSVIRWKRRNKTPASAPHRNSCKNVVDISLTITQYTT